MENLKYNLFDLFAYLLPGSIMSLCFLIHFWKIGLCNNNGQLIKDIIGNQNSLFVVSIFIVVSYLLGFVSSAVVNVLVDMKKYWKLFSGRQVKITNTSEIINNELNNKANEDEEVREDTNDKPLLPEVKHWLSYKSGMYVMIREYSKENFQYIERWNTLKNMTQNLSFVILFATIFLLYNLYSCISFSFIVIHCLIGFFLFFVLFAKSKEYADWAKHERLNAVSMILEDKKIKNKVL
jgi:hypothetical protein